MSSNQSVKIRETPASAPAPLDLLQRYTINEATFYLRQSRAKTYQQIRARTLRVIREGARTYVPGTEIARLSALPADCDSRVEDPEQAHSRGSHLRTRSNSKTSMRAK